MMLDDKVSEYRVKIILLKDEWYAGKQIRQRTNHHDNIRKRIYRINYDGLYEIVLKKQDKQHIFDLRTW